MFIWGNVKVYFVAMIALFHVNMSCPLLFWERNERKCEFSGRYWYVGTTYFHLT